jgi:uncharacterized membrane protein
MKRLKFISIFLSIVALSSTLVIVSMINEMWSAGRHMEANLWLEVCALILLSAIVIRGVLCDFGSNEL